MSVKCAECGFLAAKKLVTRELVEADSSYRNGQIPSDGQSYIYDPFPVCTMRVANFEEEIGPNESAFLRIASLDKPRNCKQFITWQPGLSPDGHREMRLLQEVNRMNAEFYRKYLRVMWFTFGAAAVSAGAALWTLLR